MAAVEALDGKSRDAMVGCEVGRCFVGFMMLYVFAYRVSIFFAESFVEAAKSAERG